MAAVGFPDVTNTGVPDGVPADAQNLVLTGTGAINGPVIQYRDLSAAFIPFPNTALSSSVQARDNLDIHSWRICSACAVRAIDGIHLALSVQ
jgi:hypothetical protein